jgi:hypothetical protein
LSVFDEKINGEIEQRAWLTKQLLGGIALPRILKAQDKFLLNMSI